VLPLHEADHRLDVCVSALVQSWPQEVVLGGVVICEPFQEELEVLSHDPCALCISFCDIPDHAGRTAEFAAKYTVRDLHVACVGENSVGIERIATDVSASRLLIHNKTPRLRRRPESAESY